MAYLEHQLLLAKLNKIEVDQRKAREAREKEEIRMKRLFKEDRNWMDAF